MTTTLLPETAGRRLQAWAIYAAAALVLTAVAAGVATQFVSRTEARAIWFSAALACALQLVAFAGLLWVRNQAQLFLAGWVIGMTLRFGALGGVAWWLSRSAALPRAAALLSLVGFVFLLLLLEPVFLRWDLRKS
jgi:hypothetical protein